jgi:hypothetical protein
LDFNLRDFIERTALQELVVTHSDHLLEVKYGIIAVVQLFERFCFIEIALAHCYRPWLLLADTGKRV